MHSIYYIVHRMHARTYNFLFSLLVPHDTFFKYYSSLPCIVYSTYVACMRGPNISFFFHDILVLVVHLIIWASSKENLNAAKANGNGTVLEINVLDCQLEIHVLNCLDVTSVKKR